jgi:glycosidase
MKKFLFVLLMSISVVIFADPPPLMDAIADEVQYVIQDEVSNIIVAAQEVAYIYRGNTVGMNEAPLYAELITRAEVPPMPVCSINYCTYNLDEDLPPLLRTWQVANYNYNRDMQFSNYGYPISMN